MRKSLCADIWDDLLPAVRWNAVLFHLDRLIGLGPEDPDLRQHRAVIQHEADQTAQRGTMDPTVGLVLSAEPPSRQADLLKSLIVTAGVEDPTSLSSVQTVMKTYFASNRPEAAETVLGVLLTDPLAAPAESRLRSEMMSLLGETLLRQGRYVEAGTVLQECLRWFEKNLPGLSPSYIVQGLLGWSLLGQKNYDESEKYLVRAYEGLKKRQVERPSPARALSIREIVQHLVQLYEAWGKPDEATKWRQKSE